MRKSMGCKHSPDTASFQIKTLLGRSVENRFLQGKTGISRKSTSSSGEENNPEKGSVLQLPIRVNRKTRNTCSPQENIPRFWQNWQNTLNTAWSFSPLRGVGGVHIFSIIVIPKRESILPQGPDMTFIFQEQNKKWWIHDGVLPVIYPWGTFLLLCILHKSIVRITGGELWHIPAPGEYNLSWIFFKNKFIFAFFWQILDAWRSCHAPVPRQSLLSILLLRIGMSIEKQFCEKCNHSWYPVRETKPKVCPRCKSYDWQKNIKRMWYIMKTETQYLILQGHSNIDSSLLIKFDGQYSYWGSKSHTWISDPSLKQIDDKFKRISESEARKYIKTGVPPRSDYRRLNHKLDYTIIWQNYLRTFAVVWRQQNGCMG